MSERVRSKSAQSGCVTPSTPPHNLPSSQAHHENAEHSVPRSFFPSPSGFGVNLPCTLYNVLTCSLYMGGKVA